MADAKIAFTMEQVQDLAQKIMPILGTSAPISSTEAAFIGQQYLNTATGEKYFCFDKDENGSYWQKENSETYTYKTWARVRYYSDFTVDFEVQDSTSGGQVVAFDKAKFHEFVAAYPPRGMGMGEDHEYRYEFSLSDGFWQYETAEYGYIKMTDEEFQTRTGITFEVDETYEYSPWIAIEKHTSADTGSEVREVIVRSKEEYDSLGFYGQQEETLPLGEEKIEVTNKAIKEIYLEQKINYIPDHFGYYCINLDDIGQMSSDTSYERGHFYTVEKIGNNFCSRSSLNRALEFIATESEMSITVGNYFLALTNFNANITMSTNTIYMGSHFLFEDRSFNSHLYLGGIYSIGRDFMTYCTSYNENINNVLAYSQKATAEGGMEIGDGFLSYCSSFNNGGSALSLPWVKKIGSGFMSSCTNFNNSVSLERLVSMGDNFMYQCSKFAQPFDIPQHITSWTLNFDGPFAGCNNFTGPVNVGKVSTDVFLGSNPKGGFAGATASSLAYTTGVTFKGEKRAEWLAMFPDASGSTGSWAGKYRKVIDGNE